MTIQKGDQLPSTTLMEMTSDGPAPVHIQDLCAGMTVALFSVPGAFTPTCSAQHLPSFVNNAEALKAKGVDEIVCMAVNDPFVMGAWGTQNNAADKVRMLADGNGDLTKALGLEFDGSKFGLGLRSQRFSMVIKDGVVAELNLEEGGAYDVSSAEYMLDQL